MKPSQVELRGTSRWRRPCKQSSTTKIRIHALVTISLSLAVSFLGAMNTMSSYLPKHEGWLPLWLLTVYLSHESQSGEWAIAKD